ncbi:hypothetical protein FE848_18500 [Marinobacter sp. 1-3A]|uniref:hypothetical protein n=1 Tax=Marinobacter sp. 1-3A TaxID=2582920 RepID=UPI001906B19A|nr:hypothetical protein [Marinobacter sp. 1-3A]MBK1875206.1 hypothetical protein [Marinobacter sp. 1-3A]
MKKQQSGCGSGSVKGFSTGSLKRKTTETENYEMAWDYERKKEKETEIQGDIENYLREAGLDEPSIQTTAKEFLEKAIRVSPPQKEEVFIHMVIMAPSGRGGGRSSKAGNIKLNIRVLFEAVSGGVFTVISAAQAPWAIPFAAILLWNSIWKNMQVSLTEAEAVTLWAMWQVKDSNKNVKAEDIKPAVDSHAQKYERQTLSEADIKHALQNLKEIGCIKPAKSVSNTWWLCEWVSPSYR